MEERQTKIYLDETFGNKFSKAFISLNSFCKSVTSTEVNSIKNRFNQGVPDEVWIPSLGKENAVVITQDNQIYLRDDQRRLYKDSGLNIIFFEKNKKINHCNLVQTLTKKWDKIIELSQNEEHFAYKYSFSKKRFTKLD